MIRRKGYTAPLAIHCIWNFSDSALVEPLVSQLALRVSRDVERPYSLGVNIPLFMYASENANAVPNELRDVKAARNVCFVFTSEETAGRENWKGYYSKLMAKRKLSIVPVALNAKGLSAFSGINAIRYEDGEPGSRPDRCLIAMLHEIFRYGFTWRKKDATGHDSSIKVFLSHSKRDDGRGVEVVTSLRKVIDSTNMRCFFDATSISPGRWFEKEIRTHLDSERSAIVAVQTDGYSSRYWCQKEILLAKEYNLPFLLVNYLSDVEDRAFPAAANVPVTRIDGIDDKNLLLLLTRLLTEAIRCKYARALISEYKTIQWVPANAEILIRPPEIYSLPSTRTRSSMLLCYPEPPLYKDELAFLERFNIKALTPLQFGGKRICEGALRNKVIGLSISDIAPKAYDQQTHPCMVKAFACDVARHILARGGVLLYGGDLRHDGFTEYIISEAAALQNRIRESSSKIINYLAWPLYVNNKDVLSLRADYGAVLDIKEVCPAKDIKHLISQKIFLPPTTPESNYVWSRCLTEMREQSICSSYARICAGGKLVGYKGKMPGLLEEIEITLAQDKMPLYLCGGFGGAVGEVCNTILTGHVSAVLTEDWQLLNNVGYKAVQEIARNHNQEARYTDLTGKLQKKGLIRELSNRSGLTVKEYSILMSSPFIDECIHLILKGLSKIVTR